MQSIRLESSTNSGRENPRGSLTEAPRFSVRGKAFAIPFAIVLLFCLWLTISMAFRFQAIMNQLERSRADWPTVSLQLKSRYAFLNAPTVQLGETDRLLSERLMRDIEETTQFDSQSQCYLQLDELARKVESSEKVLPIWEMDGLDELKRSESRRKVLQSGFVGRCTIAGLRLKLPPLFLPSH